MGKRSKDEMETPVSEEPSEKPKKNKKEKKDRELESSSAAEPPVETPVVEPETPKDVEELTVEDFERAKPVFKKWLSDEKNKYARF